jgi:2-C-methyl-D-erythritol 4-phosphate cytidylyltransferase
LVASCLKGAQETGACIAAMPVTDTVKRAAPAGGAGEEATVLDTLPRGELWLAQTPQVARRDLLERAAHAAAADGREGTDEASLLEFIGVKVRLVRGDKMNLKVTTPEDLALAEAFLARASAEGAL